MQSIWFKVWFFFIAYGTSLIHCGSQFSWSCCTNHPKWLNMRQKTLQADFGWSHYVLQALCGQVYARSFVSEKLSQIVWTCTSQFGHFSSILGSQEGSYIDFFIFIVDFKSGRCPDSICGKQPFAKRDFPAILPRKRERERERASALPVSCRAVVQFGRYATIVYLKTSVGSLESPP